MDPEKFLSIANSVANLPTQSYFVAFEFAHAIVSCLYVKEDITGAHAFSRKHPLACYISAMVSIFSGAMMVSFLLGEPILASFKNTNTVLIATGAWYLVFYTPFDVAYKIFKFLPIKIVLSVMKEVFRCKKVYDGVLHASKIYPGAYLIMVICGTLKGNGAAFTKILERLLRGVWTPSAMEIMQPSFPTKSCIVASIVFVLDIKTDYFQTPHSLIYFGICIFFVYFKLSALLLGIHDAFLPFENLFCSIFLGGIFDTFQRLLTPASKGDQTSVKSDAAKNGKTESAKKKE